MKKSHLLLIVAVLGIAAAANPQRKESVLPSSYPYSAAFISTITTPPGRTELVVFPVRGSAFKIPIRSASGAFHFSPDGRALFGACTPYPDPVRADEPTKVAICKIDLKSGLTTPVPNTIRDLLSHDGEHVPALGLTRVFGLTLPGGKPIEISLPADGHPWIDLSLSPDNERAVATHHGRVQLIDINHGTAEPLGDELVTAAWSPDGKWLAALEKGEQGRTILMGARNLKQRRILGPSELGWSPDSHYLLGMKQHGRCGAYYGTLEAIDIESGERITITSSECQVNQATTGWVRTEISER